MNLKVLAYGIAIWIFAFVYSMIIMTLLGIDYTDPNLEFGINHPQYWTFEAIMTPSMFILIGLFLWYHFNNTDEELVRYAITFGLWVMVIQFILDIAVIVYAFGNGWSYFIGLVTITYLTIPLWSFLIAKYVQAKKNTV